jgi:hypothetical protein
MKMKKLNKWQWAFAAFLAIMTLWSIYAEFFGHHDESLGRHWWTAVPFFWIWFGLVGCVLLIVFAKNVLAPFIYKKEDYYND